MNLALGACRQKAVLREGPTREKIAGSLCFCSSFASFGSGVGLLFVFFRLVHRRHGGEQELFGGSCLRGKPLARSTFEGRNFQSGLRPGPFPTGTCLRSCAPLANVLMGLLLKICAIFLTYCLRTGSLGVFEPPLLCRGQFSRKRSKRVGFWCAQKKPSGRRATRTIWLFTQPSHILATLLFSAKRSEISFFCAARVF
jgi:hypothetical protein